MKGRLYLQKEIGGMSFNAKQSFKVKYTTGACLVRKKDKISTGQTDLHFQVHETNKTEPLKINVACGSLNGFFFTSAYATEKYLKPIVCFTIVSKCSLFR